MALKPITDFASQILKPYINNQDKAYAANIAPVETSPATAAHTAGTQLIYNGVLYDVTANIAIDDALATTGAGANISAADKVTEQISSQKQALSDEVEARAILTAHNYCRVDLNSRTTSWGPTFTVNADKSITISGSKNDSSSHGLDVNSPFILEKGSYTISDGQADDYVALSLFKASDNTLVAATNNANHKASFTLASDTEVYVYISFSGSSGRTFNTTVFPMICLASDGYPTYRPYVPTNSQLLSYKDNGVLGAKNFAKCEGTTRIIGSEVQFTVNDDGSVTANTVATTTATRDFTYMYRKIKGGTYKISGSPSGSALTSYFIWIGAKNSAGTAWADVQYVFEGEEKEVTIPNDSAGVEIILEVRSGQTISNKIFKPLLRLASDTDPTYQPYAMTNRELTEKVIYTKTFTLPSSESWSAESLPTNAKVIAVTANDSGDSLNGTRQYEWYVNTSGATPILCVCPRASTMYSKSCTAFYTLV